MVIPASTLRVAWRKASRSQNGANNCVELAKGQAWAAIRDSKNPDGPAMVLNSVQFRAFIEATADGTLNA